MLSTHFRTNNDQRRPLRPCLVVSYTTYDMLGIMASNYHANYHPKKAISKR